MPNSEVLIRLGSHAEKDYLIKTANLFGGVIVGANLLEMTPGATVSLAWRFKQLDRRFAIDPLTYVFTLAPSFISSEKRDRKTGLVSVEMKKSFQKICKSFGGPFSSVALDRSKSLTPGDFSSPETIDHLAACVLSYQQNRMSKICEGDPQLLPFVGEATPSFAFGPYFYIPGDNEAMSSEWQDVCTRATAAFGRLASPIPKHAVICISRRLLWQRDRLLRMLTAAMASGCEACWLWISNLKEEDVTTTEAEALLEVANCAAGANFPLYNMHGGFLSALLSKHGMSGFSHGIGYGESKDVFPVSGGALPTVSYHYNPLHVKCSVLDIDRAFSTLGIETADDFHRVVCDCAICTGTLRGNLRNFRKFGETVLKPNNVRESQTPESAKRCRFHFLLARKKELDLVNGHTLDQLRALANDITTQYEQLPVSLRLRDRSYPLKSWMSQL